MTASTADLTGKVAIVTGAAGGIGAAYARGLAGAGATVLLADLNLEGAEENATRLVKDGGQAEAVRVDITEPESVRAMVDSATSRHGGVDILVNNAALMAELPKVAIHEFPLDWWDRLMSVNVRGALLCTQTVVPGMKERGGGCIINQSSAGAYNLSGAYSVSKLAIVGLTVVMARDLGKFGIRVNAIAPGIVSSEAGQRAATPALLERVQGLTPLHAVAEPDELIGPLLFLASDASGWMTGQTLSVDGGWVMRV